MDSSADLRSIYLATKSVHQAGSPGLGVSYLEGQKRILFLFFKLKKKTNKL